MKYLKLFEEMANTNMVLDDKSEQLKNAVLKKFGIAESSIVPKGVHSHDNNYYKEGPSFEWNDYGIRAVVNTGQTFDWDKGGKWTDYRIVCAKSSLYKGEYSCYAIVSVNKNSHESPILSERVLLEYSNKDFNKCLEVMKDFLNLH